MKNIKLISLLATFVVYLTLQSSAQVASVDPFFSPVIETATFLEKRVDALVTLADGRLLVAGRFSEYNGVPVGGLIRIHTDGQLDTSFNNYLLPPNSTPSKFLVQPDGKILLPSGGPQSILRYDENGYPDPSFVYGAGPGVNAFDLDSDGRLILNGNLNITRNGVTTLEKVVRLNLDGSVDLTFDSSLSSELFPVVGVAGRKPVLVQNVNSQFRFIILNEDGSLNVATETGVAISSVPFQLRVLNDGKILLMNLHRLQRFNANGTVDPTFQVFSFAPDNNPKAVRVASDGRLTFAYFSNALSGTRFVRLLPDGTIDQSFTPYVYLGSLVGNYAYDIQTDGGVVIGDFSISSPLNRFMRLLPSGSPDTSFNTGGTGFQNPVLGKIRAICPLPNDKVMIGGNFQKVSGIIRPTLARLNPNGSLDELFQITVGGSGTYFSEFTDVYAILRQGDGKIILSGNIKYYINGSFKQLIVRINPDGTIDPTFNLSVTLLNYFEPISGGPSKVVERLDGRLVAGQTSGTTSESSKVPLGLNSNGSLDPEVTSGFFSDSLSVAVDDISLMPNGKILLAGHRHTSIGFVGFLARLNSNGTIDPTFNYFEQSGYRISDFELLPSGKILFVSKSTAHSMITRMHADGQVDSSFFIGAGANGKINALTTLEDGRFVVGGLFSSLQGQPRENLAVLDEDGNYTDTVINTNGEVLTLTADTDSRVFIGGSFTRISNQNDGVNRSHVARLKLIVSSTEFDYDGDGRSDLSVHRPSDNIWYLLRGTAGYTAMAWGEAGDRMAPADYDGDGKTDVAVFRPSNGIWYLFMSQSQTFQQFSWGADGDLPVPTDRDNDGRTDLVVFRPSNNTWYTRFANNTFNSFQFGSAGDKPLVGDFDGDGVGDIAVFRPSDNNWYIIKSSLGFFIQTWGAAGDIPVPADFDGDGATDQGVFRPSTGQWFLSQTTAGFSVQNWGQNGDVPIAADYDGDGKSDVAVFRPSNGTWYIVNSTAGQLVQQFGQTGDVPTQSSFIY